jgi:hypothetical protein
MSGILIAYDNDNRTELRDLFEACADDAKQACVDNGLSYESVCPPTLTEENVIGVMPNHHLCFIASHGDYDGIYNESKQEIISIRTTNYNFGGKGLYSIACSCAKNLGPHLLGFGLQFFVGYNELFVTKGDLEPFVISAMSGLKSVLSGDNVETAKEKMLASFDEQIAILDTKDRLGAAFLLRNKEALVFEGDGTLVLSAL